MATATFTGLDVGYVNAVDTQTITVTGNTFSWTPPTYSTYYYVNNPYVSTGRRLFSGAVFKIPTASGGTNSTSLSCGWSGYVANGAWSGASNFTLGTKSFTTSTFFSSSNPTVRTINGVMSVTQYDDIQCDWGTSTMIVHSVGDQTLTTVKITLDVPPTFDVSSIYYDTAQVYAGLTTASVDVSNLSAKYGGNIDSAVLTIGNQTDTRTTDGTLSIALNAGGTFTPTVTVTDSRGQTTTQALDPITVNVYTAPSVSFDADRTTATGVLDDEGAYSTLDATFTFTDVIATLQAPTITATDEDGVQTTPTATWYSSRGVDGTLSGSVTWSSLSSGDTVYALLSITGGFNTQKSYQISVTPEDSESTGTPITQTLSTAFYTLDFLAGGHGIAIGKPAINTGFECAMDATFEEDLVAQDMTAQEIDDFVDSIGGGVDSVGLKLDYAHCVTITALPYTVQGFGVIMYAVGDGSVAGARNLIINGQEVGWFQTPASGGRGTITAFVSSGDIVNGTYSIWGTMRFIPYTMVRQGGNNE